MDDDSKQTEAAGGLSGLTELLGRMRMLEVDHEPLGWPAVQMQDISALCDEVDRLRLVLGEIWRKYVDGGGEYGISAGTLAYTAKDAL